MFKVNNKNTRTTSFTSFWRFLLNFEHISYLFFSASIVDSLQVNHYSKMKETADLVIFTEEIFNGKIHFLYGLSL